jgi:glutamyl-Q tRNA(Asp) synthetase
MPGRPCEPQRPTAPVTPYIGRFAPSPTGPLHAGSLVAALASWLDARAHGGTWLVRIEDVDTPRCIPGADDVILQQLAACGLLPDAPPVWQSQRSAIYEAAVAQLQAQGDVYRCACSRKDIAALWEAQGRSRPRHGDWPYPGTCRAGLHGRSGRALRLRVPDGEVHWHDRRLGAQHQDVAEAVGDFVLQRADGLWAYQLAVVVDDGAQGISHIVRGEDLTDNTPRQIVLQQRLGLPTPSYLHTPLVNGADGHKLSKQNGAQAVDVSEPLLALQRAAAALGLAPWGEPQAHSLSDWLQAATLAWTDAVKAFPDHTAHAVA